MARNGLSDMPFRRVIRISDVGKKNLTLTLECNHRVRHSPGVPLPIRKHCLECTLGRESHGNQSTKPPHAS